MKMKRRSKLLMLRLPAVVLALALVVAACGDGADTDGPADAPDDTEDTEDTDDIEDAADDDDVVSIAFVASELDITQYFGQYNDAMRQVLDEAGLNYEITEAAPAGGQEDHTGLDRILGDIETLAPDYLSLVVSDFELIQARLQEISDVGTKIVLSEFIHEEGSPLNILASIATDHFEAGEITGYEAMRLLQEEKGLDHVNIAMFHGTASSEIGIERMKGYVAGTERAAEEFGMTFEIVDEVWVEFNRELAFNRSQQVGQAHPDLDVIYGANSNTSLGVMEGLRTIGRLGDVEVTGIGGQLEELAGICRGEILTAGVRNPREAGAQAGEAILADLAGEPVEERQVVPQAPVSNCDEVLDFYPQDMLDNPEFVQNLEDGQWPY